MRLEKATASSSEAGLAGWISSNDVTLFTMVLVVIIALFLHANLIKGQSENEELTSQNESLNEDLTSTGQQLDETREQRDSLDFRLQERDRLLARTRTQLDLTQQERDKLNADLLDSLRRIEALDAAIASLSTQKSALEQEKSQLTDRGNNLTQEKAALTEQKDALTAEKATLNERLGTLASQLEDRVRQLQDLEKQRERLEQQADALDEIVTTLEQKLAAAGMDMQNLRASTGQQQAAAAARIQELTEATKSEQERAEDYLARLRRAATLFRGLEADKQTLQNKVSGLSKELDSASVRFQQQLAAETRVNRELVSLNGQLRRVAILFDASGSMKEQGTGNEDRWAEAQKIALTWLAHLEVDECVLIVFSSEVHTFPSDGRLVKIRGAAGEGNRKKLLDLLRAIEPKGWTNTLAALQTVYGYEGIDTILLFSDGAPTNPNSGRFDAEVARQIYALCQAHKQIPVNTIGLGNYFDPNMSTFLRSVARITGGTFRGR